MFIVGSFKIQKQTKAWTPDPRTKWGGGVEVQMIMGVDPATKLSFHNYECVIALAVLRRHPNRLLPMKFMARSRCH